MGDSVLVSISTARRIVFVIHIFASFAAATLTPLVVIIFFVILWDVVGPSEVFCAFRRVFIRLLSGQTLRPFTLRASLPRGTSVRGNSASPR